ncbi:MAG: gfo/Idh/MocA family oxidoreductase, partial [Planctomycetes bacterium]|nr:gfo/Idh/MocA family oxidoreductase [Planctomycetota bacterium]
GPSSASKDVEADPMNLAGAGGGDHFGNFIGALRSGKSTDLTCDIEEGLMSTALPHLGYISYRLGRDLSFDGAREKFIGDREANKMLTRRYRKGYEVPAKV